MLNSFPSNRLATVLFLPEEYCFCSLKSPPWERWKVSAEGMLCSGWDMRETGSCCCFVRQHIEDALSTACLGGFVVLRREKIYAGQPSYYKIM